jgi:hypothetical protein
MLNAVQSENEAQVVSQSSPLACGSDRRVEGDRPVILEDLFSRRAGELAQLSSNGNAICPDSTPVLFFGCLEQARILTVGLNPSSREFSSKNGVLQPGERRFAHASDLQSCADPAAHALDAMRSYFQTNPFEKWFRRVERLTNAFGASLWEGTAAHTDIGSCFATDPTWSGLNAKQKARVSASGFETFAEVVAQAPLAELLILIGGGARDSMIENAGLTFRNIRTPLDDEPNFRHLRRCTVLSAGEWQTAWSGKTLSVLVVNPYLNGTPCAPLTSDEIAKLPTLLRAGGWIGGIL